MAGAPAEQPGDGGGRMHGPARDGDGSAEAMRELPVPGEEVPSHRRGRMLPRGVEDAGARETSRRARDGVQPPVPKGVQPKDAPEKADAWQPDLSLSPGTFGTPRHCLCRAGQCYC